MNEQRMQLCQPCVHFLILHLIFLTGAVYLSAAKIVQAFPFHLKNKSHLHLFLPLAIMSTKQWLLAQFMVNVHLEKYMIVLNV